jgi:hypothetical protein
VRRGENERQDVYADVRRNTRYEKGREQKVVSNKWSIKKRLAVFCKQNTGITWADGWMDE